MVFAKKRRLSSSSSTAAPLKRAVSSRTDSGLRTRGTVVSSISRVAQQQPPVKRSFKPNDNLQQASKRQRLDSNISQKAARDARCNAPSADKEMEKRRALLLERKAARQLKWSQRALGGRRISAACFGTSAAALPVGALDAATGGGDGSTAPSPPAESATVPLSSGAAANAEATSNRPQSESVTATNGDDATDSAAGGGGGATVCASPRDKSRRHSQGGSGAGSVTTTVAAAGGAAPAGAVRARTPAAPAGVSRATVKPCAAVGGARVCGGVRLNKAAERRLQLRQLAAAKCANTTAPATAWRRHTMAPPAKHSSTGSAVNAAPRLPARRLTTTAAASGVRRGGAGVSGPRARFIRNAGAQPPAALSVSSVPPSSLTNTTTATTAAATAGTTTATTADTTATAAAAPSNKASQQRRTLSAMHRAGRGSRSTAIHAVARTAPRSRSVRSSTLLTPTTSAAVNSVAKRVRRNSFSIDEAVVAATPHIRRPWIRTPTVKPVAVAAAPQTPSTTTTAVAPPTSAVATPTNIATSATRRRTPVGFVSPSANLPLQFGLEKWLAKRGKSLSSYRHLQCFHSHATAVPVKPGAKSALKRASVITNNNNNIGGRSSTRPTPAKKSVDKSMSNCIAAAASSSNSNNNANNSNLIVSSDTQSPLSVANQEQQQQPPQQQTVDQSDDVTADQSSGTATETGSDTLNRAIEELRELQSLGLPLQQLQAWLVRLSEVPGALQRAGYWLCHAAAAESQGRLDQLLDSFRQASCAQAEPVSELVDGLQSLLSRAAAVASKPPPPPPTAHSPPADSGASSSPPLAVSDSNTENLPPPPAATASGTAAADQPPETKLAQVLATPGRQRRRPLLDTANIFRSSTVKYAVTEGGPGATALMAKRVSALLANSLSLADSSCGVAAAGCTPSAIITPVRRSTRRRRHLPDLVTAPVGGAAVCAGASGGGGGNLHVAIFDSLETISHVLRQSALFARNTALKLTP